MTWQTDMRAISGMLDEIEAGTLWHDTTQRQSLASTRTAQRIIGVLGRLQHELSEERYGRKFEAERHAAVENGLREDIQRLTDALEAK